MHSPVRVLAWAILTVMLALLTKHQASQLTCAGRGESYRCGFDWFFCHWLIVAETLFPHGLSGYCTGGKIKFSTQGDTMPNLKTLAQAGAIAVLCAILLFMPETADLLVAIRG